MDRISRLPDDVLSHILSFLPTKHAVGTSVLSSRWLTLWYFVTVIDLDDTLYFNSSSIAEGNTELFIRFIDRVMSLNQSQTILKFQLRMGSCFNYGGQTLSKINGFIQNVISRNVVELVLDIRPCDDDDDDDDCLKIPHSESLKVLDVSAKGCRLKMPSFPGCFPSLRVFNVYVPPQEDDEWMTKLFPCLPALYADIAERTGPFNFNIGGPALTHLELELLVNSYDRCDAMVVIDAPKLDYLMLRDGFMASYLVKHKPAISEVRLHVGEEENGSFFILSEVDPTRLTRFDELLRGLVNTKFLRVYATQLQLVSARNGNLPLLPYLTKLELHVTAMSWILVLHWLQSCPNLKVLSVIISDFPPYKFKEAVPDFVPLCLSSCIKEIEIKKHGKVELEKMLIYLLDNAKVLDNLTVDSHVYIKDGISHVVG